MRNFTNNTAALSDDSSATIRRNAAGGLDLIVGGQTISFTATDLTPDGYGFRLPDESAGIWAWNGDSMADALDPANGRYSLLFNYYAYSGGDTGVNGFALIGTGNSRYRAGQPAHRNLFGLYARLWSARRRLCGLF